MNAAATDAKTRIRGVNADVATVTVGELRTNFKAVEAKLAKGLRVRVTRRGAVVAEMAAPVEEKRVIDEKPVDTWSIEKHRAWVAERASSLNQLWDGKTLGSEVSDWLLASRNRDDVL